MHINSDYTTQFNMPSMPLEQFFAQNGVRRLTGTGIYKTQIPVQQVEQPQQIQPKSPALPTVNVSTSYIPKQQLSQPVSSTPAVMPSTPASAPSVTRAKPTLFTNQQDFVNAMLPYATKAGERLGVDPYMIIAQSAHETGWGRHAPNFNYFGIKGKGGMQTTKEFLNGQWVTVNAPFKGYANMEDSVNGYADFLLRNRRYQNALQAQDAMGFLQGIYNAGYATDPNYVSKVGSIYRKLTGA